MHNSKISTCSSETRLHWAIGLHPDAKIILADNGNKTSIGASYNGETHFFMDVDKDEIEHIRQGLGKKVPVINYKVPKGRKNFINPDTRKVVVTKLNPELNILRLYWRIPNPMAPSGQVDIFWCDVGRDGNMGPLEELSRVLEQNKIRMSDVIRKDL